MKHSHVKGIGIVASSVLAGLVIGGGVVAWAGETSSVQETNEAQTQIDSMIKPKAPPKDGENVTIGPWRAGEAPPDLTPVQTDDGRQGYLRVYDMANATPEKQKTRRVDDDTIEVIIPVYDKDGQTVIGQFTAGEITEE